LRFYFDFSFSVLIHRYGNEKLPRKQIHWTVLADAVDETLFELDKKVKLIRLSGGLNARLKFL